MHNHLVGGHDIWLLALALVICAGSVFSALKTYGLSLSSQNRDVWLLLAGVNLACGIWGTHFVSMLAYEAPFQSNFATSMTAFSLLLAFLATSSGLAMASDAERRPVLAPAGGALIGAGIAGMHYVGMGAWMVPAEFTWNLWLVALSVASGLALAAAAMWAYFRLPAPRGILLACGLFMAAICSLHFIGMAALTLEPSLAQETVVAPLNRPWVAVVIALLVAACFGCGIVATTVERLRGRLDEQLVSLKTERLRSSNAGARRAI